MQLKKINVLRLKYFYIIINEKKINLLQHLVKIDYKKKLKTFIACNQ